MPIDNSDRKKAIKQLEKLSFDKNQSQIFIETPYRNEKMFADLMNALSSNTDVCIAADITLESEYIKTKTVAEWKIDHPNLQKRPAIFIVHKA